MHSRFIVSERQNPLLLLLAGCIPFALPATSVAASLCFSPDSGATGLEGWAFEFGVAMITNSSIEDFSLASVEQASGPAGGEIYSITAARRIGELRWSIGGHTFTPQIEIPFTLEIVDENGSPPFPTYNLSLNLRWVDFPWNHRVSTTLSMGLGLSYSSEVYQIDKDRHRGEYRSKLKFNWPIQLTLAMPEHPGHQLMIFISHHSGGHIFDEGGINSLGMGYRLEF